ncbi:MAG: zinc metalloprotease HtpX [Ignavibacteriales bacterium]|nr:zinc metalloprotease HtpX [Ignavibacteriales bacterium]
MNALKSGALMALMTGLFLAVGWWLGGNVGMVVALVMAAVMNFVSYWYSDKIALGMYRAKEVDRSSAPKLYDAVARLSERAGLPTPKVYVIQSDTPNAFATGRNPRNAAVAVTTGVLRALDDRELEGVIAHELSHVKNRDILVQTVSATFAGAVTMIAHMASWAMMFGGFGGSDDDEGGGLIGGLLMIIVAPIAATVVQLAISRSREYMADESGAKISGDPRALASALEKLQLHNQRRPIRGAEPATAHMFVVNPLSGGGVSKLFSTHPPIEERVKRLRAMA